MVHRYNNLECGAPRVEQVADSTVYVVMPDASGAIAIINEHAFLNSNLSANFNPYTHIRRPRPAAVGLVDDVICRFDRHVDHTHGSEDTTGTITFEQTWASSQSDSSRISSSQEIAAKFLVPGLPDMCGLELSAKVEAAHESARASGVTRTFSHAHLWDVRVACVCRPGWRQRNPPSDRAHRVRRMFHHI